MTRYARSNARYAFFKQEMRNQDRTSDVGTKKWRKKHGYRADEVRAMRQKYRREVLASGDGSVVPTPVWAEGYRNRRTRRTRTAAAGEKFDRKQVGTRLKRTMLEKEALYLANPEDVRAELEFSIAQDEYAGHLMAEARYKIAEKVPAPAALLVETFDKVI